MGKTLIIAEKPSVASDVSKALGKVYDDPRFAQMWRFVDEDQVEVYLQRRMDAGTRWELIETEVGFGPTQGAWPAVEVPVENAEPIVLIGRIDGIEQLAQALFARIVTPTGALVDDPSFGYDVRENLNDTSPSPARIAAAVRSQWLADERVLDAQVAVTFADETLRIEGFVESSAGPFRLVIAVGSVTSALLSVEAA